MAVNVFWAGAGAVIKSCQDQALLSSEPKAGTVALFFEHCCNSVGEASELLESEAIISVALFAVCLL